MCTQSKTRQQGPPGGLWPWALWLTCDIKAHVSFHSPDFIGGHATVDSRNSRVSHDQGAGDLWKKRQLELARGQGTAEHPTCGLKFVLIQLIHSFGR